MSYRTPLILIAAVLLLGIGGGVLYQATREKPVATQVEVLSLAQAADALVGFSLLDEPPVLPPIKMTDETGAETTFEAFRGKVVLMNLWATWCPPCIREMPDLNALQADFAGRDFMVVPVASGKQGREDAAEFLRDRNLTQLKTYYDPHSSFLRLFDLETLPTSFVIDRTGRVRGGVLGVADWHSDEAKALIEALLSEPG